MSSPYTFLAAPIQTAPRAARPTPPDTPQRREQARRRALRATERLGRWRYSPICGVCRSRIDVLVYDYDDASHITHSRGTCRTPGCVTWDE